MLFDDLADDPRSVYLRVLGFLGVEDDGRRTFEHANVNTNLRSPGLARVHRSMSRRLGPLYAPARALAREAFAPQVVRLASLLDRDLSHWR